MDYDQQDDDDDEEEEDDDDDDGDDDDVFCENEGSGWKWSGKEGNKLIHINSH